MKTLFFAAAVLLAAPGPAAAWDLRLGVTNVQVRDQGFEPFTGGSADRMFNVGGLAFAHGLHARASARPYGKADLVFGLRYGATSGAVEGVETSLRIAEPEIGLRRRVNLNRWLELYGQALVSAPYARVTYEGAGQAHSYWAAFPMLTPSLGATVYPKLDRKRQIGFAFDVGYATPAPLDFRGRAGVDPGTLAYGGLTYGLFAVWRSEGAPKTAPASPMNDGK